MTRCQTPDSPAVPAVLAFTALRRRFARYRQSDQSAARCGRHPDRSFRRLHPHRRRSRSAKAARVGDDAAILPRDAPKRPIGRCSPDASRRPAGGGTPDSRAHRAPSGHTPAVATRVDDIAPAEGRAGTTLAGRLAKSQNAPAAACSDCWRRRPRRRVVGGGRRHPADRRSGPVVTASVVENLRRMAWRPTTCAPKADAARCCARCSSANSTPTWIGRSKRLPHNDKPSVLLVVGVNGTGKTTTVGKLA